MSDLKRAISADLQTRSLVVGATTYLKDDTDKEQNVASKGKIVAEWQSAP
jgi:hypothetical protein